MRPQRLKKHLLQEIIDAKERRRALCAFTGNVLVVTVADLDKSLRKGKADLPVGDVATRSPFVVHLDDTLYEVLGATKEDYGRILVVDRDD